MHLNEYFVLLGCDAAEIGCLLPTFRDTHNRSLLNRAKQSALLGSGIWDRDVEKKFVTNYQSTLRHIPEERTQKRNSHLNLCEY
jgi:hypothetical protein